MKILKTTSELNGWLDDRPQGSLGFVPTMGALHKGHISLLKRARQECDFVVLSILVNPTQFGNQSDIEQYPRTFEVDAEIAKNEGVDVAFVPSAEDLYGGVPHAEKVDYGDITSGFEACFRPGHFDGVVAVVDKLFRAVTPDKAFFGEKDLQQVAVVRRLASQEYPSIEIVSCELVRAESGLALSSRNTRLSEKGVADALCLSKSLQAIASSCDKATELLAQTVLLNNNTTVKLEYLKGVNEITFKDGDQEENWTHIVIAGEVEGVRLIDNVRL